MPRKSRDTDTVPTATPAAPVSSVTELPNTTTVVSLSDHAVAKAKALAEWTNALHLGSLGSKMVDDKPRPYTVTLADGTVCEFR